MSKFTFEDWVNDNIPIDSEAIPSIDKEHTYVMSGHYPEYLLNKGELAEEEYRRITDAQLWAFNKVKSHFFNRIEDKIINVQIKSPDPKGYLELRKSRIQKELQEIEEQELEAIYAGYWSSYRIDGPTYKKIKERDDKGEPQEILTGHQQSIFDVIPTIKDKSNIPPVMIGESPIIEDRFFRGLLLVRELHEINDYQKEIVWIGHSRPSAESESADLSKEKILMRYHNLYKDGAGLMQAAAYQEIENWLLKEHGLTVKEVKDRFGITLEFDSFTRNARNNRF